MQNQELCPQSLGTLEDLKAVEEQKLSEVKEVTISYNMEICLFMVTI
jgi:hypothetical protein